jgi:hypothetical protein
MTDLATTVAPPQQSAARRFSQQVHALVDTQTRELLLGLAIENADQGGYARPREGEVVRELLDDAITRLWRRDPRAYERAVRRGRAELAARSKPKGLRGA